MATQKCKECGKTVSTKANKCPHCGAPIGRKFILFFFTLLFGGMLFLTLIFISTTNYLDELTKLYQKAFKAGTVKHDVEKPAIQKPSFIIDKTILKNSKYLLLEGDTVELRNGDFENNKSGEYLLVKLEYVCFGDLNNDGVDDAAVILGETGGGSGYFYYLYTVINESKKPEVIKNFVELGDRKIIKSFKIQNGEIIIDLLTHRPGDALASPTLKKSLKYKFAENKIVKLRSSL